VLLLIRKNNVVEKFINTKEYKGNLKVEAVFMPDTVNSIFDALQFLAKTQSKKITQKIVVIA